MTTAPDALIATEENLLAFTQVAEQHRSYLKCVAARIITSTEEAEDVVQQALLKAFMNLSRFRGDAKMRTWLHTIVLNTAREYLRSERRRPQIDGFYEGEGDDRLLDIPHPGVSPEDYCERTEIAAILRAEIDMLTPDCKRAIEMCVLRDLSQHDAARELNTNVATLKSRVYRAKGMLKRALDERNFGSYSNQDSPG